MCPQCLFAVRSLLALHTPPLNARLCCDEREREREEKVRERFIHNYAVNCVAESKIHHRGTIFERRARAVRIGNDRGNGDARETPNGIRARTKTFDEPELHLHIATLLFLSFSFCPSFFLSSLLSSFYLRMFSIAHGA